MTMRPCSLLSLATAVPPYVVEQAEAKALAREAFGGKKALFDRLSGVFDNAGIARRHIVAPLDWYMAGHGWNDRNAVYLEAAEELFIDAATAAIEKAGLTPDEIDGVVTVSTTGIATPSLEARCRQPRRLSRRHPPRAGVRPRLRRRRQRPFARRAPRRGRSRQHLAVRHRRDLLDLDPARQRRSRGGRRDGLVRRRRRGGGGDQRRAQPRADRRIGREALARHAADHGLGRRGSGPVGGVRPRHPAVHRGASRGDHRRDVRASSGSPADEIDRFCCHPGGVKVIDAIEAALELNQGELNLEREVLRDYGNMSAPTVLFVLDRLLERGTSRQGDDDRVRTRLHLRRPAARSRVILNVVILGAGHAVARLVELWLRSRQYPPASRRRRARESRPAIIR